MKTKINKSKVQKALESGEIITFEQMFANHLKEGRFTMEHFNEVLKEEMEEDARFLRAKTARKVRKAKLEMETAQEELAKKLQTIKSFISEIENGKQNVSIEYDSKVAKALNKKFVCRSK